MNFSENIKGFKDYAKTLEHKEDLEVTEDMLMSMDSGGASQPGTLFDTPQSLAGGMDTFAKLGPGKPKKRKSRKGKKKKKGSKKRSSAIISFVDFINK